MESVNIGTIINIVILLPMVIYGLYVFLKYDKKSNQHNKKHCQYFLQEIIRKMLEAITGIVFALIAFILTNKAVKSNSKTSNKQKSY